ncbi:MAG: hypothetical protein ACKOWG_12930 [Planctomycetia bacterium]
MKLFGCMARRAFASLTTAGLLCAGPTNVVRAAGQPAAEEIDALVAGLGADDYAEREAAAAKLNALGAAAVDPLLAAAEVSDDLEIALRARWLVDTTPLETERDPPEVAKLLDKYKRQGFAERVQVMHRLLRVDDDGGIEPLARIVRLERAALGSRVAAALLAREWQPDDPAWIGMRDRISAGLGASVRPAASFLRGVVSFSSAADAAARNQALLEAGEALVQLTEALPHAAGAPADDADSETVGETTLRIFKRCRLQMLIHAGGREETLAEAGRLLRESFDPGKDAASAGEAVADTLVWLVERGLPEAVDLLAADRPELIRDDAVVGYAAALAERGRHRDADADTLAAAAFAKPSGTNAEFIDRLQTAIMLVRWGAADWATREYKLVVEDPRTPAPQYTMAAVMFAEFLHDQEREDEAAACLRRLLEGREDKEGNNRRGAGGEQLLQQFGRDPRSIRSRMHYFESCAAAAKGDAEARRRAIDASVRAYARDVDALIGLYALPDNTAAQKADAVARIRRALEQIENEIKGSPEETNNYNEYAWLVANTEGDVRKATRYSKFSLVKSFDSSSYLDTLAHCHAAAGNKAAAVRTQSLALRHEPHNRTIRKNLARFEGM